jgi:hypothetical protein
VSLASPRLRAHLFLYVTRLKVLYAGLKIYPTRHILLPAGWQRGGKGTSKLCLLFYRFFNGCKLFPAFYRLLLLLPVVIITIHRCDNRGARLDDFSSTLMLKTRAFAVGFRVAG